MAHHDESQRLQRPRQAAAPKILCKVVMAHDKLEEEQDHDQDVRKEKHHALLNRPAIVGAPQDIDPAYHKI